MFSRLNPQRIKSAYDQYKAQQLIDTDRQKNIHPATFCSCTSKLPVSWVGYDCIVEKMTLLFSSSRLNIVSKQKLKMSLISEIC